MRGNLAGTLIKYLRDLTQVTCEINWVRIAYDNEFHLQVIPMQALTAEYLSAHVSAPAAPLSLAECSKGQQVLLCELRSNPAFGEHDGAVTARMKSLGFLPGVQLTVIGYGLFGRDPLAVQVNGTKFALRRAEAQKLVVLPL